MRGDHYSVGLERNDEGWWPGECACGWKGGVYPEAEDACDALMDHAFAQGILAAPVPDSTTGEPSG